jgi:hypothetical protein
VNLDKIIGIVENAYVKLLKANKYNGLTESQRICLDIPIMQWKLGFYYGSYFLAHWLEGSRENINLDDANLDELVLSSSVFVDKFNEGVEEINEGDIYGTSDDDVAVVRSRTVLETFLNDSLNRSKSIDFETLVSYGTYSNNKNHFKQKRIKTRRDCVSGLSVVQSDYCNAIAGVYIRFYFEGSGVFNKDGSQVDVNIASVKWRFVDQFEFKNDGFADQDLGDWKRDVFSVVGPRFSIMTADAGYTSVENGDFAALHKVFTGSVYLDAAIATNGHDYLTFSKTYTAEAVVIKKIKFTKSKNNVWSYEVE